MDLALPQITNDLVCPLRQKPQGARVGHFEIGPLHSVLQKRGRVNLVRPDTFYKSVNLDLQNVKKIFWTSPQRLQRQYYRGGRQTACFDLNRFINCVLRSNEVAQFAGTLVGFDTDLV